MSSGVLEEEDVKVIFERLQQGERGAVIARDFAVSQQSVSAIKHGKVWGHVTGLSEPKVRAPRDRVTYSTLTEAQVLEINRRLKSGSRKQDLAELFDVSYSTIHAIEKGRAWGWLTGNKRNKEA